MSNFPKKQLIWESSDSIHNLMNFHHKNVDEIMHHINTLQETLESTRVAYNKMIVDRDAKRQQLVAAEGRIAEVQRVVQRYIMVQDPVVASDGYTYERSVIQQYLEDCAATDASAYSQQTKEVLKDILIPNQSLKKLVDMLKAVKPQEIPVAIPRSAIQPFRQNSDVNWDDDEESGEEKKKAIHVSELEAGFSQKSTDGNNKKNAEGPARAETAKDALLRNSSSANRNSSNNNTSSTPAASNGGSNGSRLHPCLRVYGFCNFKDDCTFARYPFDACLNNIKGKCRFGQSCKELHVNPSDAKYQNPKNASATPAPRK